MATQLNLQGLHFLRDSQALSTVGQVKQEISMIRHSPRQGILASTQSSWKKCCNQTNQNLIEFKWHDKMLQFMHFYNPANQRGLKIFHCNLCSPFHALCGELCGELLSATLCDRLSVTLPRGGTQDLSHRGHATSQLTYRAFLIIEQRKTLRTKARSEHFLNFEPKTIF